MGLREGGAEGPVVVGLVDRGRIEGVLETCSETEADLVVLGQREPEGGGDLRIVGGPEELLLEGVRGLLDVAPRSAKRPGERIEGAQAVEHSAADVIVGVGGEPDVAIGVVGFDGGQELWDSGGLEVSAIDPGGELPGESADGAGDEGSGGQEERIAEVGIAGPAKLPPDCKQGLGG
jgi:hypothetical protein